MVFKKKALKFSIQYIKFARLPVVDACFFRYNLFCRFNLVFQYNVSSFIVGFM